MKLGLALGGGGARGLAHLPLLRLLDERGIKPDKIVGTSMGAIIGALYASGLSASEIEERLHEHMVLKEDHLRDVFKKSRNLVRWVKILSPNSSSGGLIKADGLFDYLFNEIHDLTFDDLKIPLKAIACDYHTGEEVVLDSGDLLTAVQASMAVPGVFSPVEIGDWLLVDGGLVNNLGYELAGEDMDFCIAFDVTSLPEQGNSPLPSALEIAVGSLDIMQLAALEKRLDLKKPDILIRPDTSGIDFFDLHRMEQALEAGEAAREELARALDEKLPSRLESKSAKTSDDDRPGHGHGREKPLPRWRRVLPKFLRRN
jgi:NTE family protein